MKLFDVDFKNLDTLDPFYSLKGLYDVTGNVPESGFLAEDFIDCDFDDNNKLEFTTDCEKKGYIYSSCGVVLNDSVLIKQIFSTFIADLYFLYSWDTNDNIYTLLTFDDEELLDKFYDGIKNNNINLCSCDIADSLKKANLKIEDVKEIFPNQKLDPLKHMLDDYEEGNNKKKVM